MLRVGLAGVGHGEGLDVDIDRGSPCNEEIGGHDLRELIPDENPDGEVGALKESSNGTSSKHDQRRSEGIELIFMVTAAVQLDSAALSTG